MICVRTWLPLAVKKSIFFFSTLLFLSSSSSIAEAKSWFSGSQSFTKSSSIDGKPLETISFSNQQHQGFIGCLFVDTVCSNDEICFDDDLFGQCVLPGIEEENLERFDSLSETERQVIMFEAHKLDNLGYSWTDEYSQCVLENLIFAIKSRTPFNEEFCFMFKNENESSEQISSLNDDSSEEDIEEPIAIPLSEYGLPPSYLDRDDNIENNEAIYFPESSNYSPQSEEASFIPLTDNIDDENIFNIPPPYQHRPILMDEEPEDDSSDFADIKPDSIDEDDEDSFEDQSSLSSFRNPERNREIGSGIFNRNERYDVKKPGPFFPNSENNFFLNKLLNSGEEEASGNKDNYVLLPSSSDEEDSTLVTDKQQDQGQLEYENPILAPVKDKRDVIYDPIPRDILDKENDDNYVHIGLKKRINTWQQGSDLITALAETFDLPDEALSDRKIENQHVQFRVEPNPQSINAQNMAEQLSNDSAMQKRLTKLLGVEVNKAVSGNEENPVTIESLTSPKLFGYQLMILVVVLASTIAALFVTGVILCLVRKKARKQAAENKLNNFQDNTMGKTKIQEEYKDLCRDWSLSLSKNPKTDNGNNKTSTKNASGSSASTTNGGEPAKTSIGNVAKKQLSKESEGSNRSSTSSWSEDPTNTNMDISTGHMVLAYMEDHLKNKQRLEQEWVGLCGYEAEPCSTTVAFKSDNKKKNRYPDKLPYDHNRVILNALLNSNNSDYINASTVTDHDPRNPSYIVTQGPLAQTVPDFWQMIWEQGCVVIVMLTRLQDQEYTLCHRYWPEEGSEQYHIFEVHLVSEHVWCDDYLVRSVYLKNTRTGETRTVTQFHFRSWPAHGIPTSTKALLEFRRKVNKSYRGRSCPIAVHCSDGVGRSGTYVLIDMVLNRMSKGCKEIDIAATLEHIRDQRGGMVQNRSQFEFCLMAVAEEVHAILKALPALPQ